MKWLRHFQPSPPLVVALIALLVALGGTAAAQTIQLVRIADRTVATRVAQVDRQNALSVNTRAGILTGAFSVEVERLGLVSFATLQTVTAPTRVALTHVTVTGQGPSGAQDVILEARVGAASDCSGGTARRLQRVAVSNQQTLVLSFSGPPLFSPTATSGQRVCVGFRVVGSPFGSAVFVAATGYTFTP